MLFLNYSTQISIVQRKSNEIAELVVFDCKENYRYESQRCRVISSLSHS